MRPVSSPATVRIAPPGDLRLVRIGEHVHAVLVWTGRGESHDQTLAPPVPSPAAATAMAGDRAGAPASTGSSSGHGLRTWLLGSVMGELRHLPAAGVAPALAVRLVD